MAVDKGLVWVLGHAAGSYLTLRALTALVLVCRKGTAEDDVTIRGLTEAMAIPKPSVTRAVDLLEEFALITRAADPRDRRSILVVPTEEGAKFVAGFLKLVSAA